MNNQPHYNEYRKDLVDFLSMYRAASGINLIFPPFRPEEQIALLVIGAIEEKCSDVSRTQVAHYLGTGVSNISPVLKALEQKNVIEYSPSKGNKNHKRMKLTEIGREYFTTVAQDVKNSRLYGYYFTNKENLR